MVWLGEGSRFALVLVIRPWPLSCRLGVRLTAMSTTSSVVVAFSVFNRR